MKDILKYLGLFFVGLFIAIIIYPFLHEAGHSLAAILVGAKVRDFNLLPLPYVTCEVSNLNTTSMILIGLAGMFVPALISMIIRPKSFWVWYGSLVMRGICLLSFVISFISIVLYLFGVKIKNEDIVQVIDIWDDGIFIFAMLMVLSMIVIIHSIIKQNPLDRVKVYFKCQ